MVPAELGKTVRAFRRQMVDRRRFAVDMVVAAYKSAVGRPIKLKVETGTKLEQNAVDFWGMATSEGRTVGRCMQAAVQMYSKEWCLATFHRPYPPFSIAVGPKAQRRVAVDCRPRVRRNDTQVHQEANEIYHLLCNTVGRDKIAEVLASGWPEDRAVAEEIARIEEHRQALGAD